MNIAIIQARAGSKRIPGKNIKDFLGKPIIQYTIEAALACEGVFDKVIVTTDSKQIAETAKNTEAEIPFIRPAKLADDYTNTWEVIEHAIIECEKIYSEKITNVCCLYATAPFLRSCDIRKGYEKLMSREVSSVFSVTTFPFPILRSLKIEDDGHLEMFWPEHELTRSNDLPEAYHDAGQFYWLNVQNFLEEKKMYGKDALPIILPRIIVQDIDTHEDWKTAEILYQVCKQNKII